MSPAPKRKPQHRAKYRVLQGMLRAWRERAGLTQRDLGKRMGRLHTFVHKAETGERRLDPFEWADWVVACEIDPKEAFALLFERSM